MDANVKPSKSPLTSYLFSSAGVAIMFVIMVAIYVISGAVRQRFDLTQERLYTLSDGTKAILNGLDTPVEIRFYCSQSSSEMPVQLKAYAQQVENLLDEYRKASRGNIEIRKFDPQPDSDAEESANLDGVEGQGIGMGIAMGGDKIYLGMAVSCLDAKMALPFLSPEREKLLEYDLSRAIAQVSKPSKPVIGVMTALPVFGEFNPMMMQAGRMSRQNPWVFISELKKDFEVKQIDMGVDQIEEDLPLLVVIYPREISQKTLYALDQYVLRGGKLIAFLDPLSFMDSRGNNAMNPMQRNLSSGATLEPLLKAWGLTFDVSKVVADLNYVTHVGRGTVSTPMPAVLSLTREASNADDVVTGQIDSLLMAFAGVFSGTPADGLKQTVLLKTSINSQLVEKMLAEFSGEQISKDFIAAEKEQNLAIRLTGKFKTAFPDGKPKDAKADSADDKSKDTAKEESSEIPGLKESKGDGAVVLVGDSDMLHDQFSVQIQQIFGQQIVIPRNGNLTFVQSLVEQMAGNSHLIQVRSRATMNRPFTLVKDIQARASKEYQRQIQDLEKSLADTQQRLNELQQQKREAGQRFILSEEQKKEVENYRAKEREAKIRLKELRKNLRKDIDSLEIRLKWLNIAGMPLLVTISGIALATIKRKKTAAK